MNKKQYLEYLLIVIGVYLLISFIEAYLLRPAISLVGTTFSTYFITYNILLLIVNPIVTKIIADLLINRIINNSNNNTNI